MMIDREVNLTSTTQAKISYYEKTYSTGLLANKTIYYEVTETQSEFVLSCIWEEHDDFKLRLRRFSKFYTSETGPGFMEGEVLNFILTEECYYDVAEFVDMLREKFE